MSLKLPQPGDKYDRANEAQARGAVERADQQNWKRGSDINLVGVKLTIDGNEVLSGPSDVTAGTYGDATHVSRVTFDAEGRAIAASAVAITFPVTSFNTRTGAITLSSADVTTALTYTPVNKAGDTISGALTINNPAATNALSVKTQNTSIGVAVSNVSGTAGYLAMVFYNNGFGSAVGSIASAGSATSFNTSSDERLKDFTGPYSADAAAAIIKADPARSFTWKADGSPAVGWGAQTSHTVSPELATPGHGEIGDEDYTPWGVDQGKRTPYLWAVVGAEGGVLDRLAALEAALAKLQAP